MAQDNSGAVSAVQSVSSKSNVGNVGSDTEGLPSQNSVDIATGLAAEFKQPDEKIPEIAQAVEGLVNGKTQADRVDSFKKLAELLGIDQETLGSRRTDIDSQVISHAGALFERREKNRVGPSVEWEFHRPPNRHFTSERAILGRGGGLGCVLARETKTPWGS